MTIETTSTLASSLISRYKEQYEDSVERSIVYDQLAVPWASGTRDLQRLSDANFIFLSEMEPAVSAISEVVDVTPEVLEESTASISPTSRFGALQASEKFMLENYAGYGKKRMDIIANNAAEGIDL